MNTSLSVEVCRRYAAEANAELHEVRRRIQNQDRLLRQGLSGQQRRRALEELHLLQKWETGARERVAIWARRVDEAETDDD